MTDIYEKFDISLGIKKNNKFITIKNTYKVQDLEKVEEKSKNDNLKEILEKVKKNTEKLKKENEKLEKEIMELKDNINKLDKPIKKSKKMDLLENIKNTIIENNTYDNLLLSFDYDKIDKQNFTLLEITKKMETVIKTYLINSNIAKEDNIIFYDFTNNYKSLKIIAKYYDYKIVLYDINQSVLDTCEGTKIKMLNFLFYENKIYPLKQKPYRFSFLLPKLNNSINGYIKRDNIRNSRYILFEDLSKYKNYFIKYKDLINFKYKYLLDEVIDKKIEDITDEHLKIYKYLITNFGLQFYIIENYLKINKNMFNLDFISKFGDYIIPDFPKNEYDYLKEHDENVNYKIYYYTNNQSRNTIYGNTKEQIIEKGKNIDIIINENEIKKSFRYLDMSEIKTESDILIIKELLKNQDFIYYKKKPDLELILATEKINLDNNIDAEYIIELYNKEPINYCKMCNCSLNWNTISIDAIIPMFGHVKKNIQLLCLNCNRFKNIKFIGKYSEKPYYYDINTLSKNKLIELLKYHNLDLNGITFTLRKRLEKYIKNLD